jgi:hypothetical protein
VPDPRPIGKAGNASLSRAQASEAVGPTAVEVRAVGPDEQHANDHGRAPHQHAAPTYFVLLATERTSIPTIAPIQRHRRLKPSGLVWVSGRMRDTGIGGWGWRGCLPEGS